LAVKEKNDPQKGEFIDLEKTEFKKKSNFFPFFLKSLFFALIFFGLGMFVNQVIDPNLLKLNLNVQTKKSQDKPYNQLNLESSERINLFNEDIEEISRKIKSSELFFENLEARVNQINLRLDEINEKTSEVNRTNYKDYIDEEIKQYKLLKNYLIFKDNLVKREELGSEIFFISDYFKDNFEAQNIINFFNNIVIEDIATEKNLLDQINNQIKGYEFKFDDFFGASNNNERNENQDFVRSKEDFFNYLNDLFNSTFKVIKYNNTDIESNIKRNGDYRKILQKAKEYLIIGDLSTAYEIVKESKLDMTLLNDWSLKVEELKNVKIKIIELENLIFKKLGKDFD